MLRTPPSMAGHRPASQPRPLAIYGAQCWERLCHPPVNNQQRAYTPRKLGFALCWHINATRAPIANLPNSAQLGGSFYSPPPKLHLGPCSNVGVGPRTDTHTDRLTHTDTRDHNTFCVVYDLRKMQLLHLSVKLSYFILDFVVHKTTINTIKTVIFDSLYNCCTSSILCCVCFAGRNIFKTVPAFEKENDAL